MAFQQISDRLASVQTKLGNRSDLDLRIYNWLRDAYIEMAYAYSFDELQDSEDQSSVDGTSKYNYPSSVGVNNAEVRAIESLALIDTNGQSILLDRKSIRIIDEYSTEVESRPSIYATWNEQTATGVQRFIELRPVPDSSDYTLRWRVWLEPIIESTVQNTYLRCPLDWLEIIDYGASIRGFTELLEHDRANATRDLLYGFIDPTSGRRQPGLIASRMTRRQAEYRAGLIPRGNLANQYGHR